MRFSRLRRRSEPAAAPTAAVAARTPTRVDRLLGSGIFEQAFYEASVGRTFPSQVAAARHCLNRGMANSFSPSPFLDIASLPQPVQAEWRAGRITLVLEYLQAAADSVSPVVSPLFDTRASPGSLEDKLAHPGGALGLFLSEAVDTSLLPVPVDYPSAPPDVATARRVMTERMRATAQQHRLTRARISQVWDEAAEQAWKESVDVAPSRHPADAPPLVSVVTPVRNRPELVIRALRSLQAQTLTAWEVLVVDDGSTDQTPDVVRELAARDPRIRLVSQPPLGVGAARNRGLALAEGRLVAFLDSDNTWRPDFLSLTASVMVDRSLPAAYAAARIVDAESGLVSYRAYQGGLDDLLVKNHIDLNTLVVDRELALDIGGFDEELLRWVDHDFALRIARRTSVELLPFIGCDYDDDRAAPDRITTTVPETWQFVALGRNWVDWQQVSHDCAARDPRTVSVVVPTYQDWRMTRQAVLAVLADADAADLAVEVVIVDNGSVREVGSQLSGFFLTEDRVRYLRLPRNLHFAIGCNVGFAASSGSVTVFLNNDTVARRGWLSAMLPRLEDPSVRGVQPLLLYSDDTIQTAGTIFCDPDFLPTHYLVGHPPEDAELMRERSFSAVTAAVLAVRAEEFAELRGFDPIYVNGMEDVDYCLRAVRERGGRFLVEPAARVTHLESKTPGRSLMIEVNRAQFMQRWRGSLPGPDGDRHHDLGLTVAHLLSDGGTVPTARPLVIRTAPDLGEEHVRLRWGLKVSATPGPYGDLWGDTHLAASLASALRRRGQDVVSYRHGTHTSSVSHLDDVVLGIRGLDVVRPQPGKVNILWIISHPDDVTPEELQGFDLVFAASESWGEDMTARSGVPIAPLHQAVDTVNIPDQLDRTAGPVRPVFVGGHHGRHRQAIHDAAHAGIELVIHGPGWDDTSLATHVASEYVPNHELPTLYRDHGLVLADHWPDMAANGFIANRVFDAVASGAMVVSDDVTGVEEVFEGAVRVYQDVEDLRHLCSPDGRNRFPSDEELTRIAGRVASEHSFDSRAAVLLDAALDVLRSRGGAGAASAPTG